MWAWWIASRLMNGYVSEQLVTHFTDLGGTVGMPVIAVVGRKEAEQRTVALRRLGGEAQELVPLDEAVARLAREATAPDLARASAA